MVIEEKDELIGYEPMRGAKKDGNLDGRSKPYSRLNKTNGQGPITE